MVQYIEYIVSIIIALYIQCSVMGTYGILQAMQGHSRFMIVIIPAVFKYNLNYTIITKFVYQTPGKCCYMHGHKCHP